MVNIQALIDDAKCFQTVREIRWPDGVRCPECGSAEVAKDGRDDTQPERQRYHCHGCRKRFDDLTGTIFAGHHQPLRIAEEDCHIHHRIWRSRGGPDTSDNLELLHANCHRQIHVQERLTKPAASCEGRS